MTQAATIVEGKAAEAAAAADLTRVRAGELISECMATFIILGLGDSVAAMYVLYDPSPVPACVLGRVHRVGTGGDAGDLRDRRGVRHACQSRRDARADTVSRLSPRKVLPYVAAQVAGAFLGAALVYQLFGPVIDHFNLVHHLTRAGDGGAAGVFFTHPGDGHHPRPRLHR